MLKDYFKFFLQNQKSFLLTKKSFFQSRSPLLLLNSKKNKIKYIYQLLNALSPQRLLKRGFALITDESGHSIYSVKNIKEKDKLLVKLSDGKITAEVASINCDKI